MPDSIKISEFTDVRGAFHCEHKPQQQPGIEKGRAILCDPCAKRLASGASMTGEGYSLRQTAFGGWVKTKAAAK
jgi:hypothetical protein